MEERIVAIAAETIKVPIEKAKQNMKEIPELNAWYFWNPVRGGLAVIVDASGEKLGATSAVSYEKHVKAFLEGKRN